MRRSPGVGIGVGNSRASDGRSQKIKRTDSSGRQWRTDGRTDGGPSVRIVYVFPGPNTAVT